MKKILISISTVIITVSMLCITAFGASASTVPLKDVIKLGYVSIYQLSADDTERYTDEENNTIGVTASDGYTGSKDYQAFAVVVYYEGPDIKPYETVQFRLSWKMTGDLPWPFTFREVFVRDSSKSLWDFVGQQNVGRISFGSGTDTTYSCYSNISYTNTTKETIVGGNGAAGLTFVLGFKSKEAVPFYEQIQVFDADVTNFYVGDLSSPDAPVYSGHEDLNNSVTENGEIENEIIENNQQGIEEYNASLQGLNMLLEGYADSLLAFSRFFEYVIYKFDWLYTLLSFGLCLGAISFVLNLYNSFKRRN